MQGRVRWPIGAVSMCMSRVNGQAANSSRALIACSWNSSGAPVIRAGSGRRRKRERNHGEMVSR
ncbi:hypothetical protein GCM10009731_20610 [Streptomyces globosus]